MHMTHKIWVTNYVDLRIGAQESRGKWRVASQQDKYEHVWIMIYMHMTRKLWVTNYVDLRETYARKSPEVVSSVITRHIWNLYESRSVCIRVTKYESRTISSTRWSTRKSQEVASSTIARHIWNLFESQSVCTRVTKYMSHELCRLTRWSTRKWRVAPSQDNYEHISVTICMHISHEIRVTNYVDWRIGAQASCE